MTKPTLEIILKLEKGEPIVFFRDFDLRHHKWLACYKYVHAEAGLEYFRALKPCNQNNAVRLLANFRSLYSEYEIKIMKRLNLNNFINQKN